MADHQVAAVSLLDLPVQQRGGLAGVGAVEQDPAGRCAQRLQFLLQDQPAAVQDPDPRAQLLHFGEQMAGQEDRHPAPVQVQQQLPGVTDTVRVQPVAGFVQDQQPGPPDERSGQAEPLAHAEGVGLHRAAVDAGHSHLLQRVVDPAPPGPPVSPPAASSSLRFARPDRFG